MSRETNSEDHVTEEVAVYEAQVNMLRKEIRSLEDRLRDQRISSTEKVQGKVLHKQLTTS